MRAIVSDTDRPVVLTAWSAYKLRQVGETCAIPKFGAFDGFGIVASGA